MAHTAHNSSLNKENTFFCLIVLFIMSLLVSSFIVPERTIVNAYMIGPRLWFYLQTGILLFFTGCYLLSTAKYRSIKLNFTDILMSISLLYILLQPETQTKDIFFADKLINYLCLTLLYFILRFYITSLPGKKLKNFITVLTEIILLITFISAVYGLLQLYNIVTPNDYYFKVTGQFISPAPYANYLIALLPFCVTAYFLYPQQSRWNTIIKYTSVVTILTTLLVLPVTYTRSAWIGIIAGTAFILFHKYKIPPLLRNRRTLFIVSGVSLVIILIFSLGLYHLKPRSADGRVVVWKVCTDIIRQNPVTGIGYGNFEGRYNTYQAAYFAKGNTDPMEIELADKVYYPYNIFLQILCEQGVTGLILFIAIIISLLPSFIPRLNPNSIRRNDNYISFFMIGSAATIISVIVCGQFSYPFDILPVFIIFFICIAFLSAFLKPEILGKTRPSIFKMYSRNPTGILLLSASLLIFYCTAEKYITYSNWKKISRTGKTSEKLSQLYPVLKKDANFMAEYGKLLLDEMKYKESIKILEEACTYTSDPFICINLAKAYIAVKDYQKAEKSFILASNMIPNRLYSKYLLARLYFDTGQTDKARRISESILSVKPKIQSPATDEIKLNISKLMSANPN